MADKKVTQLTALTAPTKDDLLLIIDDPLGSPISKKITLGDLFGTTSTVSVNAISLSAVGNSTLAANNFAINVTNGLSVNTGITINSSGSASDTRIASDNQSNMFFVNATTDKIGVMTSTPTSAFDINDSSMRLRTANTPASSAASWQVGTITWDANYIYVCTSAGVIKRATLNSF